MYIVGASLVVPVTRIYKVEVAKLRAIAEAANRDHGLKAETFAVLKDQHFETRQE